MAEPAVHFRCGTRLSVLVGAKGLFNIVHPSTNRTPKALIRAHHVDVGTQTRRCGMHHPVNLLDFKQMAILRAENSQLNRYLRVVLQ